jgi:hypothetical protein
MVVTKNRLLAKKNPQNAGFKNSLGAQGNPAPEFKTCFSQ